MAKEKKQPKRRSGGSIITKVLILAILVAIGVQLRSLHVQVQDAEAERDALAAQVETQRQENDALAADIAEGATDEKMKEIAQEELRFEKDPESMSKKELEKLIADIDKKMKKAAAELNFELAAELRDKMIELKKQLADL